MAPISTRIILFLITIMMLAAGYLIFSSLTANADSQIANQQEQAVPLSTLVEDDAPASQTAETEMPQATQDGQMIINTRCIPCHLNSRFDQIAKTPTEWEETLALMEVMGMQISQDEKDVLLEYLLSGIRP